MGITRWSIPKSDYVLYRGDGEALNSQQKQDLELTVAQIISFLLQIQAQIEKSMENHSVIQVLLK